jgi:isoleucyl-tRNA synthetase
MRTEQPFTSFFDRAFENEMNILIEQTTANYDATNYKSALKTGLFDFQNARSWYRDVTGGDMHRDLVVRFIKAQTLLLAPIAPHWSEYIWRDVLKEVYPSINMTNFRMAQSKMPLFLKHQLLRIQSLAPHKYTSRVSQMQSIRPKAFNSRKRPRGNKVNSIPRNPRDFRFMSLQNFLHGNRNISMLFALIMMRYPHLLD